MAAKPSDPGTATVQDPKRAAASVRRARLRVLSGPDVGLVADVGEEGLVLGSAPGTALTLHDSKVSRRHAEIVRAPSGFILRDLGSTNGTHLAGVRIESAYLGDGTVFTVGGSDVAFSAGEEALTLPPAPAGAAPGFVAESPVMRELVAALRRFAPTDLSVVLEGETGAGKDVVARALHAESRRAERPFVVVDCGALQENLVESDLFGHERGAFTGAIAARPGAFEAADGGTLFLDEIGELPPALQPKLLRALEAREVRRLGSNRVRPVDVRIVAATNRDVTAEVSSGRFRRDLYFRLSEVRIRVPPLRERPEDVEPLARTIGATIDPGAAFRPESFDALRARRWPGNVRELGNVVRRAVVDATGSPVGPEHLGRDEIDAPDSDSTGLAIRVDLEQPIVAARTATMSAFHRGYLTALLDRYDGDLRAVAAHAGVHFTSIHRLLRHAGIKTDG